MRSARERFCSRASWPSVMRDKVACAASSAATSPRNPLRILMAPEDEAEGFSLYDIRSSKTRHKGTSSLALSLTAFRSARCRKLIVERVPVSFLEITRKTVKASGGKGNDRPKTSISDALTQGI